MASDAALTDSRPRSIELIDAYRRRVPAGDLLSDGDAGAWARALDALSDAGGDDAASPLPLLVGADDWSAIETGIVQRAALLEAILADLYGPARLVADGALPASLVTGSPGFLRAMTGIAPPGGRHLAVAAFDLIRDPGGGWRVVADHVGGLAGLGEVFADRLAAGNLSGAIARHAPFFAALREGIAAACHRADPRIVMLDGGSRAAAQLARYLGFILVEGADLAGLDERLYLRTVAGLKRVDAVWSLVAPRALDPLAFDAHATGGVAGLIDAFAAGTLFIANAPGAALIEAPAFAAFLPVLAERLTGAPLALPGVATWWAGGAAEADFVAGNLDTLDVAPAFGGSVLGLAGNATIAGAALLPAQRAALLDDLARRPQDYVGRQPLARATMPVIDGGVLVPRGVTLRVYAACDGAGSWRVLPGGLACIDGGVTADVVVRGRRESADRSPVTGDHVRLRRNPGTLPSRAADALFWLGRYLERGAALVAAVRLLASDSAGATPAETLARLTGLIEAMTGIAASPGRSAAALADLAMDAAVPGSLAAIDAALRRNAAGLRERLSPDIVRLIETPPAAASGLAARAAAAADRYAAIAGLAAEHVARTTGWRFLDLGRRIERALAATRLLRRFAAADGSADDLAMLLDLADSRIGYRQRYAGAVARLSVVDFLALDPANPRGLAFQVVAIGEHVAALPMLADDGMAEPQQAQAATLAAIVTTAAAARVDADLLADVERRLAQLSDAVARRYFLQGAEPLRASGLTLA